MIKASAEAAAKLRCGVCYQKAFIAAMAMEALGVPSGINHVVFEGRAHSIPFYDSNNSFHNYFDPTWNEGPFTDLNAMYGNNVLIRAQNSRFGFPLNPNER